MPKVSLIVYHANIKTIYEPHWIEQFKQSILGQTYKDFDILELCYNGGEDRIFDNSNYESKELPSFIHAMNYLIEKALNNGAVAVANTNCDDVYHLDWLKVELPFIQQRYDIVSSNFSLFTDDVVYHTHHFENKNIKHELNRNHNVICHPTVIYSRHFLENNRYDPSLFPEEDMLLWKQTIDRYRFKIVPQDLLLHRIHSNSVCHSENR